MFLYFIANEHGLEVYGTVMTLEKTQRLLAKFRIYCPYVLREHYPSIKWTRSARRKVTDTQRGTRKAMLNEWKYMLEELFILHAKQQIALENAQMYDAMELQDTIDDYREDIQVNKELWPLLVHSLV